MSDYQCPICSKKMARNLTQFLDHGQQHVIDSIRKAHPEWVGQLGACTQCVSYYEKAMQGGTA